jgi:hypothetical protein
VIKLSDYVVKRLQQEGVRHVFMLTGGGCMHLVDSFGRSGMEYVCTNNPARLQPNRIRNTRTIWVWLWSQPVRAARMR